MMPWTQRDIDKLVEAGKIRAAKAIGKPAPKELAQKKKKPPTELNFIKSTLTSAQIPFRTEYLFARPRLYRFDIAIPVLKIAIEYEGLVATGKKGGHQTKKGYTANCDKYNLATSMGWRVYRYTYRNYKNFENDLKAII